VRQDFFGWERGWVRGLPCPDARDERLGVRLLGKLDEPGAQILL
jgi:hypothetical protein